MKTDLQRLNDLLKRAAEYRVDLPVVFCRECGATNLPGDKVCVECKEPFPQELVKVA